MLKRFKILTQLLTRIETGFLPRHWTWVRSRRTERDATYAHIATDDGLSNGRTKKYAVSTSFDH